MSNSNAAAILELSGRVQELQREVRELRDALVAHLRGPGHGTLLLVDDHGRPRIVAGIVDGRVVFGLVAASGRPVVMLSETASGGDLCVSTEAGEAVALLRAAGGGAGELALTAPGATAPTLRVTAPAAEQYIESAK